MYKMLKKVEIKVFHRKLWQSDEFNAAGSEESKRAIQFAFRIPYRRLSMLGLSLVPSVEDRVGVL